MQLSSTPSIPSVSQHVVLAGDNLLEINTFDPNTLSVQDYVNEQIKLSDTQGKEDAFYIVNLGDVVNKHRIWKEKLSRVEPFYAVKCNDDIGVLQTLASLGTGFDCASKNEINKVLSLGVHPDRIIFAHPCKTSSHITFAAEHDVRMTTFDNEPELHKIKRLHPECKLLVRIRADDPLAVCNLGIKFGAKLQEAKRLLGVAKDLELNIIGVSFHVGSGCTNADAYAKAIMWAREVFDHAKEIGTPLTMLDLGGGYPGQVGAPIAFDEIVEQVNPALNKYFPPEMGIRIIAEPGRYMVASAFTLAVNIIAKRVVDTQSTSDEEATKFMYYINDGVYGSFNCLLYDHATVEAKIPPFYVPSEMFKSSIWGPTCDGIDCIAKSCWLPEMSMGQWLIFEDMGAYTCAASSTFNGMPRPSMIYVVSETDLALVHNHPQPALEEIQEFTADLEEMPESLPRTATVSSDEGVSMEEQILEDVAVSCAAEQVDYYEVPALPEVGLMFIGD
ncbi:ornithine decarboxylase-like [Paramacrobiotus metropolitanus]|uniref:ornithine decarboxylase-like n=1 Tax=Paramacrobiotus metropolitanus TaxID=2943436 RepID=UPI002445BD0E|nr:ornithine decarboxylase-like [Paramacrobiotus metropolitanus]